MYIPQKFGCHISKWSPRFDDFVIASCNDVEDMCVVLIVGEGHSEGQVKGFHKPVLADPIQAFI